MSAVWQRLLVSGDLPVGATFSGAAAAAILLAITLRRRAAPRGDVQGPGRHPLLCGLAVFAAVFVSRLLLLRHILGDFVYQDEALDACIRPLEQKLGLPMWGGYSDSIVSSVERLVLDRFGFDATLLRVPPALWFSIGLGALAAFVQRAAGAWVALSAAAVVATSYPFVLHSTWATSIPWGSLPAMVVSGLLLARERISAGSALVAGLLTGLSLYLYPGAAMAMACAVLVHLVAYRRRWSAEAVIVCVGAALAMKLSLDLGYHAGFRTGYGAGDLSTKFAPEAVRVTAADFFLRATSFDLLNFNGPLFEPVLLWTLVIALVFPNRTFVWAASVVALGIVVTGFTGPNPGARRALWTLPLLYVACIRSVLLVARRWRVGGLVKALLLASLAVVCARSVVIGRAYFPIYANDQFHAEAVHFLESHAPLGPTVVILKNPDHEFHSHHFWCALAFEKLWRAGEVPLLISKSERFQPQPGVEYWMLLQPVDSNGDLETVLGSARQEMIFPPAGAESHSLRVLKVTAP